MSVRQLRSRFDRVATVGLARVVQRVKAFDPAIFTVVGGHHATVAYNDFLNRDIDMIVVGEGKQLPILGAAS